MCYQMHRSLEVSGLPLEGALVAASISHLSSCLLLLFPLPLLRHRCASPCAVTQVTPAVAAAPSFQSTCLSVLPLPLLPLTPRVRLASAASSQGMGVETTGAFLNLGVGVDLPGRNHAAAAVSAVGDGGS